MTKVFALTQTLPYKMQNQLGFVIRPIKTVYCESESIGYLVPEMQRLVVQTFKCGI